MHKTIEKLKAVPELDTYEGLVSDFQVSEIAARTGCVLPSDYENFLRACGFAFWIGHAVNGIFDDEEHRFPKSYNFSAIIQTMRARQRHSLDKYPYYDNSIVIGKDDMGGYFLLISETYLAENRVVWVSYDGQWSVTQSWISFEAFLNAQLVNL